jgi:acyl carrier protein
MDNTTAPALTLEERIYGIVAEESEKPRETLDRGTVLGNELFDSLGRVELIMSLEDEFEISISDDEVEKIHTIGQLIDAIHTKLSETSPHTPDGTDAPPSP